jgi:hypothetical protein
VFYTNLITTPCRVETHTVPDPKNIWGTQTVIRRCYGHDRAVHDQNKHKCDIGDLQDALIGAVKQINDLEAQMSMRLVTLEERYRRLDAFEQKLSDLTDGATR